MWLVLPACEQCVSGVCLQLKVHVCLAQLHISRGSGVSGLSLECFGDQVVD